VASAPKKGVNLAGRPLGSVTITVRKAGRSAAMRGTRPMVEAVAVDLLHGRERRQGLGR